MKQYWSLTASASLIFSGVTATRPPVAPAWEPTACALVTRDEAAKAWGADLPAGVERAIPVPVPGGRTVTTDLCMYGSAVAVSRTPLGSDAKHFFALLRQDNQATKGDDLISVAGLGDEAFYGLGKLTIRKGSTLLEVSVAQKAGYGSRELAIAKRLGSLALSRL